MTIAMFSLTVFSLTVFSVLLANFSVLYGGDAARGNLDLVATLGSTSGGGSVTRMLHDAGSLGADAIAAEGRTTIGTGAQEVRLTTDSAWGRYPVIAVDASVLAALSPAVEWRAAGFDSDQAVLDAVSGSRRLTRSVLRVTLHPPAHWLSAVNFTAALATLRAIPRPA